MSGSLSPQQALELVLGECKPLEGEPVGLDQALGRTLARALVAQLTIPVFDNSAMDGFAVRSSDLGEHGTRLPVVGESRAGHPYGGQLQPGEAIRISTGAMTPAGADAVVRVEDTEDHGQEVVIKRAVAPGTDLRRAGDDMREGETVLAQGTRLGPAELAVLAANGLARVTCSRRPAVAIVTTGDELRPPGSSLGPGEIFNSNGAALAAQTAEAGATPAYSAHTADSFESTVETITAALADQPDILLISGGVSVGPHDHVKPALEQVGAREVFWGVAQRPGHPLWFGTHGATLIFGLPGNPVSAMVCFHVYVRRAIDRALRSRRQPRTLIAKLDAPYNKRPGRAHFARCSVRHDGGTTVATLAATQGSHALTSIAGADGLAIIDPGKGPLAAGDEVLVEFF